jgi:predicted 3-demethylubiquinone-9 3-methyltransferase (glyoxalase superfamily)
MTTLLTFLADAREALEFYQSLWPTQQQNPLVKRSYREIADKVLTQFPAAIAEAERLIKSNQSGGDAGK